MNIFVALATLPKLLRDLNLLEADAKHAGNDPELLAELEKCPKLKARLVTLSAEWRSVENDAGHLK